MTIWLEFADVLKLLKPKEYILGTFAIFSVSVPCIHFLFREKFQTHIKITGPVH